jgi:hypothetical protein
MAQMYAIIGDPDRLKAVAEDFVNIMKTEFQKVQP